MFAIQDGDASHEYGEDDDADIIGRRRRSDDQLPTECERAHGGYPTVIVWRSWIGHGVVESRVEVQHECRRKHPGGSLCACVQLWRHCRQDIARTGEEGYAGSQRTIRQLHREG